jgi:hypothetical protein
MKCFKARRLLGDYLDRRLDPELRQALKHHLAACAECRAELAALRRATDLLHGTAAPTPPPDFGEKIKRSLAAAAPVPAPIAPVWRAARLAGAIAAGLLIVGSIRWYMGKPLAELPPLWPEVNPTPLVVRMPARPPVTVAHAARDFAASLTAAVPPSGGTVGSRPLGPPARGRRHEHLAKTPRGLPSLAVAARTNAVSTRVVEETAALAPLLDSRLQPAALSLGDVGSVAEADSAVADRPKVSTALASYFQPRLGEAPAAIATASSAYALDVLTADCQVPGL